MEANSRNMSITDIKRFRETNQIKIYGSNIPSPFIKKDALDDLCREQKLTPVVLEKLIGKASTFTAIQCQIWPIALNKRNLIVCAKPGQCDDNVDSYKWPALMAVKNREQTSWPTVLILTGNDEDENVRTFRKLHHYITQLQTLIKCDVANKFKKMADILFLTPKVALTNKALFKNIKIIIVDGIDRLLETGEYVSILILLRSAPNASLLLFTSSWSLNVRVFIEDQFVKQHREYIKMVVGNADQTKTAIENGYHKIHVCKNIEKINKLCEILEKIRKNSPTLPNTKVLVIVKQENIDKIYSYLLDKNFPVLKTIELDNAEWDEFHANHDFKVLVTTTKYHNLKQKKPIQHIIIYNIHKLNPEATYLYQISLAGHCQRPGNSYLLYTDIDVARAQELIDIMNELQQPIDAELYDLARRQIKTIPRRRITLFDMLPEDIGEEVPSLSLQQIDPTAIATATITAESKSNENDTPLESSDINHTDFTKIQQYVELVPQDSKVQKLDVFIENLTATEFVLTGNTKMVIFTDKNRINSIKHHLKKLNNHLLSVASISSDANDATRNLELQSYRNSKNRILIISDKVFPDQQLFLDDVNIIINFDFPVGPLAEVIYKNRLKNIKTNKVHGLAITFFCLQDASNAGRLAKMLKEMNQVINPLLLEPNINVAITKSGQETIGNLADFYALIDVKHPVPVAGPSLDIPTDFQQIPQYVEVVVDQKKIEFLNLIRYLADRSKFPQIKILVISSAYAIVNLKKLLESDHEKSGTLLPVHVFPEVSNNSYKSELEVMNSKKYGLFFCSPSLLEAPIIDDFEGVNLVVNYIFPTSADMYLKSLRLIKQNGFAITFFLPDNHQYLKQFLEVLQHMKQPINPNLLKINEKFGDSNSVKKLAKMLANEKIQIKEGNITAFMNYTKTIAYAELSATFQQISSSDFSKIHQFVEVCHKKLDPLQNLLNEIVQHEKLQKSKIIILSKSNQIATISKFLTEKFKFAIFQMASGFSDEILAQILKSFRNGVLLLPIDIYDMQKQMTGIANVHFLINYDFSKKNYLDYLSIIQPNVVITLLTETNSPVAYQFMHILRECKQRVNPLLLQMQQCHLSNDMNTLTDQIKTSAASIKTGNITAFTHLLQNNRFVITKLVASPSKLDKIREPVKFSNNKNAKTPLTIELSSDEEKTQPIEKQEPKIKQFVEVLTDDEKPAVLLNLILHLLCGNTKYSKCKVLIFATLSHVDQLYEYLNKYGRECTAFPTVLTIPEGVKPEVRSRIISLFQHGILLISPYNFIDKMNQTEIQDVQLVINYDFPKARTSKQMSHWDAESAEKLINIYLNRVSNVNVPNNGCALTFFAPNDRPYTASLIEMLIKSDQEINPMLNHIKTLVKVNENDVSTSIRKQKSEMGNHSTIGNINAMYNHLKVHVSPSSLAANRPIRLQPEPRNNISQQQQHYDQTLFSTQQSKNICLQQQNYQQSVLSLPQLINNVSQQQQYYIKTLLSTPPPNFTTIQTETKNSSSQNHYEEVLYGNAIDPINVHVQPNSAIQHQQYVEILQEADKPQTLLDLMLQLFKTDAKKMKILIFTNKMKSASLMEYLTLCLASGVCPPVMGVTGNEENQHFDRIVDTFRSSNNHILIISDGVFKDQKTCIGGINLVINYDYPQGNNSHITYSNRVSNVDKLGDAITFFTPADIEFAEPLIYALSQMNQKVNMHLLTIKAANNLQHKTAAMQNALASKHTKSRNIAEYLHNLQSIVIASPSLPVISTQVDKTPNSTCLQYVEVLSPDEKPAVLLDLMQHIVTLNSYKSIKIILFIKDLTIEKIKYLDELLHMDMAKAVRRFPNFNRFYTYRKSDQRVITRNSKQFSESLNAVLITDFNPESLVGHCADFLIFYDFVRTITTYSDILSQFKSKHCAYTFFITFLASNDSHLTMDFTKVLEKHSQTINPLMIKLIETLNKPLSDGFFKILRRTISAGNLSAFYKFVQNTDLSITTPQNVKPTSLSELNGKIPLCILSWLEKYGYKNNHSHLMPLMFSQKDLLAIVTSDDNTTMTLVLIALGLVLEENVGIARPLVLIFMPTPESVKKTEALIRLFNGLLTANGIARDLNTLVTVEQLVEAHNQTAAERKRSFANCKFVIIDQFDQMIRFCPLTEIQTILETIVKSRICLKILSAEYSVFEKLVCLEYLKKDYNYVAETIEKSILKNNFSNIQQYVEMKSLGAERRQSLMEVLLQISTVDISSVYSTVIFFNDDDTALRIAHENLLMDSPEISNRVFYKKVFPNNFESILFWNKFDSQPHPIFLTNDAVDLQRVKNVKYLINFDYPTGPSSSFEYLLRMTHIKGRNGFVVTYFGLKDFIHSDTLVQLLEHMKQSINPLLGSIQSNNLTHNTFSKEVKALSSNSIGDLTDFFMALCLMDPDDDKNSEDTAGHNEIEKRKSQFCDPSENKRSKWNNTAMAHSNAQPSTFDNVSAFMNKWTDNYN